MLLPYHTYQPRLLPTLLCKLGLFTSHRIQTLVYSLLSSSSRPDSHPIHRTATYTNSLLVSLCLPVCVYLPTTSLLTFCAQDIKTLDAQSDFCPYLAAIQLPRI